MAPVLVERTVQRPLTAVWAVVSDVAGHRLPLTRVETDPGQPCVGWGFRAVSALGPLRLVDAMTVTSWSPPQPDAATAEYAVVKTGRVLGGWARVTLTAVGPAQTGVRWAEEITLRPHALGALARPATDLAVGRMFRAAVDEMLARA